MKALEHNKMYFEALCNIGVLYKTSGDLDNAIHYYQACLNINPNFELGRNNIAIALTDLGTKRKAEGAYREAINL